MAVLTDATKKLHDLYDNVISTAMDTPNVDTKGQLAAIGLNIYESLLSAYGDASVARFITDAPSDEPAPEPAGVETTDAETDASDEGQPAEGPKSGRGKK